MNRLERAIAQLRREPGDPDFGYVTAEDLADAFAELYAAVGEVSVRSAVATASALPTTGNRDGDVRVTLDDQKMHVWGAGAWHDVAAAAAAAALDGLPDFTGNAGKVLMVSPGETDTEWADPAAPHLGDEDNVGNYSPNDPTLNGSTFFYAAGHTSELFELRVPTSYDLSDIERVVPASGDVMVYDAALNMWRPQDPAGAATGADLKPLLARLDHLERGFLHGMPVIALLNNPPSLAPANDDAYLVGTSPTGVFAGHPNEVALWDQDAGVWLFEKPRLNELHKIDTPLPSIVVRWDGNAWTQVYEALNPDDLPPDKTKVKPGDRFPADPGFPAGYLIAQNHTAAWTAGQFIDLGGPRLRWRWDGTDFVKMDVLIPGDTVPESASSIPAEITTAPWVDLAKYSALPATRWKPGDRVLVRFATTPTFVAWDGAYWRFADADSGRNIAPQASLMTSYSLPCEPYPLSEYRSHPDWYIPSSPVAWPVGAYTPTKPAVLSSGLYGMDGVYITFAQYRWTGSRWVLKAAKGQPTNAAPPGLTNTSPTDIEDTTAWGATEWAAFQPQHAQGLSSPQTPYSTVKLRWTGAAWTYVKTLLNPYWLKDNPITDASFPAGFAIDPDYLADAVNTLFDVTANGVSRRWDKTTSTWLRVVVNGDVVTDATFPAGYAADPRSTVTANGIEFRFDGTTWMKVARPGQTISDTAFPAGWSSPTLGAWHTDSDGSGYGDQFVKVGAAYWHWDGAGFVSFTPTTTSPKIASPGGIVTDASFPTGWTARPTSSWLPTDYVMVNGVRKRWDGSGWSPPPKIAPGSADGSPVPVSDPAFPAGYVGGGGLSTIILAPTGRVWEWNPMTNTWFDAGKIVKPGDTVTDPAFPTEWFALGTTWVSGAHHNAPAWTVIPKQVATINGKEQRWDGTAWVDYAAPGSTIPTAPAGGGGAGTAPVVGTNPTMPRPAVATGPSVAAVTGSDVGKHLAAKADGTTEWVTPVAPTPPSVDIPIVATDGDRPTTPRDGQRVFNVARQTIDVWEAATHRWYAVGDIPVSATYAALPGTMLEGELAYVQADKCLYVLVQGANAGTLVWQKVGGLPVFTSADGHKSLTINAAGTAVVWDYAIPTYAISVRVGGVQHILWCVRVSDNQPVPVAEVGAGGYKIAHLADGVATSTFIAGRGGYVTGDTPDGLFTVTAMPPEKVVLLHDNAGTIYGVIPVMQQHLGAFGAAAQPPNPTVVGTRVQVGDPIWGPPGTRNGDTLIWDGTKWVIDLSRRALPAIGKGSQHLAVKADGSDLEWRMPIPLVVKATQPAAADYGATAIPLDAVWIKKVVTP